VSTSAGKEQGNGDTSPKTIEKRIAARFCEGV
jgi:hypothetical protein